MELLSHPDDWKALTDAAPLPQHWAYGVAMERLGLHVLRGVQAGRPVQALCRPGLRLIHRADPEVKLAPFARHAGLTFASTVSAKGGLPLITQRHHAVWEISARADQRSRALRPTWRHALDRATARVVEDRLALGEILAKADAQGRARGYRTLPAAFVAHWPADILVVRVGRPILAGAVFLIHGREATYLCAWANPQGLAQGAPRAILWQAAQDLAARGIRQIDLGAVDASHPGLARFKLGTGAGITALGPTLLVSPF